MSGWVTVAANGHDEDERFEKRSVAWTGRSRILVGDSKRGMESIIWLLFDVFGAT